jgi:uncharacterized DUF497 family protein
MVHIEFDSEKDRLNRQKHGVSLTEAAHMDFDSALVILDDRRDYGEARFLAVAASASAYICWRSPCGATR